MTQSRLGENHATRAQRRIDRGLGRDVAPAEILGEGAAHGLAVERGIERSERHRLHAAFHRDAFGRRERDVHLQRRRLLRLQPLDQPGRAQIGFHRRQQRQHRCRCPHDDQRDRRS